MTSDEAKDKAVELVTSKQGVKAVELIVEVASHGALPEGSLLDDLVREGRLIEVEYILPGSDRVKSFYLPVGTEIVIKSGVL